MSVPMSTPLAEAFLGGLLRRKPQSMAALIGYECKEVGLKVMVDCSIFELSGWQVNMVAVAKYSRSTVGLTGLGSAPSEYQPSPYFGTVALNIMT